ncbi:hypothetical protein [Kitasatospora aureofaciens]|uniref:hypothetical protein n=1 Tax=Kitasatospora aureofaciens TaxID=1894 RepID=UPI00382005B0
MSSATISAPAARPAPVVRRDFWRGMLWLTWRQHRWQILIATVVSAAMLIWMVVNASEIQSALDLCTGPDCSKAITDERASRLSHAAVYAGYQLNTVVFLPVLLGLFLGVPVLAREYEQRTLMLAWSQDISPLRWLLGKLTILGVIVAALATALAGEAEHVAGLAHLADRTSLFDGALFQAGGWLPLTLALAWMMFGVAAGAVLRRTLPALAVVLGAFIGRTVLMVQLRPHFMTPLTSTRSLEAGRHVVTAGDPLQPVPNDLLLDGGNGPFLDTAGHTHAYKEVMSQWCGSIPDGKDNAFVACLKQHDLVGIQQSYQPASRLGTFHLIENGFNLTMLVASLVVTWWIVRKGRTTM